MDVDRPTVVHSAGARLPNACPVEASPLYSWVNWALVRVELVKKWTVLNFAQACSDRWRLPSSQDLLPWPLPTRTTRCALFPFASESLDSGALVLLCAHLHFDLESRHHILPFVFTSLDSPFLWSYGKLRQHCTTIHCLVSSRLFLLHFVSDTPAWFFPQRAELRRLPIRFLFSASSSFSVTLLHARGISQLPVPLDLRLRNPYVPLELPRREPSRHPRVTPPATTLKAKRKEIHRTGPLLTATTSMAETADVTLMFSS